MARGLKSVHLSIPIPDKEKAGNIASLSSPSPPQRKNPFQNIELGGDANGAGDAKKPIYSSHPQKEEGTI